jgi:hypothetical protein
MAAATLASSSPFAATSHASFLMAAKGLGYELSARNLDNVETCRTQVAGALEDAPLSS